MGERPVKEAFPLFGISPLGQFFSLNWRRLINSESSQNLSTLSLTGGFFPPARRHRKIPRGRKVRRGSDRQKLSLGELGSAAGCFESVFLTLFHSRVTGQEPGLLQDRTELLAVKLNQSSGQSVADSAGLAGNAAACNGGLNVKLAGSTGELQRLANQQLEGLQAKIIVNISAVDGDLTSSVGIQATRATECFLLPVP